MIGHDCRKHSIVYESKCVECDHNKEKFQKDEIDLIDGRPKPSIYVGESGLSLHERSKEHRAAFELGSGDSHTLKHWVTNHCGQGRPNVQLDVVRYCRDSLTRKVGETV